MTANKNKNIWDQHAHLYHYTTQSGLQGILSSQSIHSTHFRYLNDRNEMFQLKSKLIETARPSVRKVLKELISKNVGARTRTEQLGGLDAASASEAKNLIDTLYNVSFGEQRAIKFFEPYIISFCGHNDEYERENGLLSQWRAYSGQIGFSVVFNTKTLCDLIFKEAERFSYSACHVGDVIYDGNVDLLQEEFGALLAALEDLYPKVMYEKDPNIMDLFLPFVSCTSRFKHRGFFEESEVRAVLSPVSEEWRRRVEKGNPEEYEKIADKEIKPVKFRHGFSPYIEIECPEGETLPIERIIVGPSLVSENTKAKLQAFLELRGLKIEVSISKTPLC